MSHEFARIRNPYANGLPPKQFVKLRDNFGKCAVTSASAWPRGELEGLPSAVAGVLPDRDDGGLAVLTSSAAMSRTPARCSLSFYGQVLHFIGRDGRCNRNGDLKAWM